MNPATPLLAASALLATPLAAASIQVGDLRLPSNAYFGGYTNFDPSSGPDTTRAVAGAPVALNSSFIAVTQNADGVVDNDGSTSNGGDGWTDIGLQTFSTSTNIRSLNRFTADQDGPGPGGGPQRAGAVQWTIDLSPLSSYLASNNLVATAVDLTLLTNVSDTTKLYDVYLSYSNPAESITLAGLSTAALTAGDDNYDNFWFPAQSTAEGSVANGTHKVLELDYAGNLALTINLLPLYQAGVTDLNLIMASGDFLSGRTISILDGSGLSIDTAPIPEPAAPALFLAALATLACARRRN